ncbi:unnamed protein product, partial [Ectocarpus fasciculatus]
MSSGGDKEMRGRHEEPAREGPDIPFPFEPYDVQKQLMRKIYSTLEKGGIGIFESPTGTGKSLSVICSALQWLKDAEAKDVDGKSDGGGSPAGRGGSSSKGPGGYGTEDATCRGGEKDDDDDGASAMPSWLKDMTQQKSDNEREARAKRVRERRRDLDKRLAAVRKEDQHRKNNNRVRGVHRPSGGAGGGGGGGRHWSSSSFALGGSDRGGAGKKRPRPKASASSSKHPHKTENQTRGNGAGSAADDDGKRSAEGGVDDEYLVAEYDSGKEGGDGGKGGGGGFRESSDEEEGAGGGRGGKEEEEEWEELGLRQILYVSRTHSQTSQFVNEVKKTAFAQGVRCASLGSRRTLCGNERVSSLKTDGKMRDACLELQKNKKSSKKKKTKREEGKGGKSEGKNSMKKKRSMEEKSKQKHGAGGLGTRKSEEEEEEEEADDDDDEEGTTDGCPLLAAEGQREFPYRALASVRDIEELADLGKEEGTCAYYGARKAASLAQLVVMPYAALLSREARAAMGVKLEGAVVVVDEAHNIVEAINSVHSKRVVLSEVARAHSQLSQYEAKYGARLKGSNAFYVGNILRLLRAVLKFLTKGKEKLQAARAENAAAAASKGTTGVQGPRGGGAAAAGGEAEEGGVRSEMLEINDFLFRAGLDNMNLFKLQRYMRRSEISRKVMGFMDLSAASSPEVTLRNTPLSQNGGSIDDSGCGCSKAITAATSTTASTGAAATAGGGAGEDAAAAAAAGVFVSKHVSALQTVEAFLDALTNASRDGRVLATFGGKEGDGRSSSRGSVGGGGGGGATAGQKTTQDEEEPSMKFLMLNPAVHFDEIVQK